MIYRVVVKVRYHEIAFDFAGSEDAIRFCAVALRTLNVDYEDGNHVEVAVKKVDLEAEKAMAEEAEDNKEE